MLSTILKQRFHPQHWNTGEWVTHFRLTHEFAAHSRHLPTRTTAHPKMHAAMSNLTFTLCALVLLLLSLAARAEADERRGYWYPSAKCDPEQAQDVLGTAAPILLNQTEAKGIWLVEGAKIFQDQNCTLHAKTVKAHSCASYKSGAGIGCVKGNQ